MATPRLTRRSVSLMGASLAVAAPARAADTMTPPKGLWTDEGHVQRGGVRIHYASVGKGPPLVLVHKLGGWIADWRHIAPALAQNYKVIALDAPGHGDSTISGPVPFLQTLPESAAVIMAALDELQVGKFAFVGNSLGGCIGVVMAALWPDRITHLGLLSVALGTARTRADQEKAEATQPAGTWGPNGEPLPRPFEEAKKRFGFTDRSVHDEQNASRAKAGAWVRASERGVGAAGVVDYLPRITAPTLLIYGERGGYKEFEAPGKANLKRVRSVHIPNAGSFTHQDNPRETEKVLLQFLAEKA